MKLLAVLPLIDGEVFESGVILDRMNLTIQCCWTEGITVMKPSMARKPSARQPDGSILISEIATVAIMIRRSQAKFESWCANRSGSSKGRWLLGFTPAGIFSRAGLWPRPRPHLSNNHLRVLNESDTMSAARAAWAPVLPSSHMTTRGRGSRKAPKRLQHGQICGSRVGKSSWSSHGSGSLGGTHGGRCSRGGCSQGL